MPRAEGRPQASYRVARQRAGCGGSPALAGNHADCGPRAGCPDGYGESCSELECAK